jgi:hypothetical protein
MKAYVYSGNETRIVEIDEDTGLDKEEFEFFGDQTVRKVWHIDEEEWYFAIYDIVAVLTDSNDPKQYIKKMRTRDKELDSKWGTICTPLPMIAQDGKMRRIQASNTEGLFRIIQSIPSPKAEPLKVWLAKVGAERLDEYADPEKAIDRAVVMYQSKGYSDKWISQRLRAIEIRKELTDEWKNSGIENSKDFAILTNLLTAAWSGKSVKAYKQLKGLHKENLRDNMTNTELALNLLAEVSTTEISRTRQPKGMEQSKEVVLSGGKIAGNARRELEEELGRSVISSSNAGDPEALDDTASPDKYPRWQ